jgi:hypothetical protein
MKKPTSRAEDRILDHSKETSRNEAVETSVPELHALNSTELTHKRPSLRQQSDLLRKRSLDRRLRQSMATRIGRLQGNRYLQRVLSTPANPTTCADLIESLPDESHLQRVEVSPASSTPAPVQRQVPKRSPIGGKMLHQSVRQLVLGLTIGGGTALELASLLKRTKNIAGLERAYAHHYGQSNPYDTKDDVNPYQLRDDIRARTHATIAHPVISYLQRRNRLPKPVSKAEAAKQKAEADWSTAARELARQRLAKPAVWPGKYRSAKASFDRLLQNRIKGWGEWILANYFYLKAPDNIATAKLGISFSWPSTSRLPTSVDDRQRYGDLEFFSDVATQFDNALVALKKLQQAAFYARGGAQKVTLIDKLRQWQQLFSVTQGTTANTMRQGITERLNEVLRGELSD